MNRRRFLSLLGLAAPAMALDPERALWVPGEKTIFDLGAPARGIELADQFAVDFDWRTEFDHRVIGGNRLVVPDWLITETKARITNYLRMAEHVNREYDVAARETVFTVKSRLPVRYTLGPSTS